VIPGRESADIADLGEDPAGDDRPDAEQPGHAGAEVLDHLSDLGADGDDLAVQGADVAQVLDGQLAADLPGHVARPDAGQDRGGLASGELAAQAAGGELGQQPVQPAYRLGAGRDQFLAAVTQQPQGDQCVVGGHRQDTFCLQRGQAYRDSVVTIGLAAMAAGEHTDPRGELGGHIHDWLAAGHQVLGQRPACAMTALHRPAARPPLPREAHQLPVASVCVRELALTDRSAGSWIKHDQRVVGLMRIHSDQHTIIHVFLLGATSRTRARKGSATSG
jgi:hypothetical protein